MNIDLTSFAGIAVAALTLIELLKSKIKWIEGKEEYFALSLPIAFSAVMKLLGYAFVDVNWFAVVVQSIGASIAAQLGHDYVLNPSKKVTLETLSKILDFVKSFVNKTKPEEPKSEESKPNE